MQIELADLPLAQTSQPSPEMPRRTRATLSDWTADFAAMIQAAWGLSSLETIAMADSLDDALAGITLIPRPDGLPLPSRIRSDLRSGTLLRRMANSDALTEAIASVGASSGGPVASGEALATIFVDQLRATYTLSPLDTMSVHQAVATVLREYNISGRAMAVLTKPLERELGHVLQQPPSPKSR